jgi:hypothetical protein
MPLDAAKRRQRARLAALRRHHPDDPTVGMEERRDFKADAGERLAAPDRGAAQPPGGPPPRRR